MQVLHDMPANTHPDLLVGTDHFDDAGVYRLDDRTALVQTLDFFPPLVDDPYTFGQIAAANSLSDVYAMGGKPITAMNIVGFPDKELPAEVLGQILKGGAERIAKAGAVIVGGHSVRDAEVKYGMSVTGLIDPANIVANDQAKPGDVLVLTKPIGSGVLTSAAKSGTIAETELTEAIEVMVHLNRGACEAMVEVGVNSATDITGFDLIGHAFEMAEGSTVSITIKAKSVPLLQRTLDLAGQGIVTRAHKATLKHLGARLDVGAVSEALVNVLADAQTSGGLLIAVEADQADALIDSLQEKNAPCAAIVGEVAPAGKHAVQLVG